MSDSDEERSGSAAEESGSNQQRSGSGSGSEDGSGSESRSGSGSGSDRDSDSGSGSGTGSDSGSGSDDESGSGSSSDAESEEETKEEVQKKQDADFVYKPSPYQQLLTTLREINLEMDVMTKSVEHIEMKCSMSRGGRQKTLDAAEQKRLLDEIDHELDPDKPKDAAKEETKEPRNYHPPDSPVRRVYENGYELDQRTAMENYPSYVNPARPATHFDQRAQTHFGTPGYTQTLYHPGQRQKSAEARSAFEASVHTAQLPQQMYQPAQPAAASNFGGPASAFGYPGSQIGNAPARSSSPGHMSISRFANRQQQQKPPPPLPPRTYTDFYRNQSYINNYNTSPASNSHFNNTGPAHFGPPVQMSQQASLRSPNHMGSLPPQRAPGALSMRSSSPVDGATHAGIQNAIETLLK